MKNMFVLRGNDSLTTRNKDMSNLFNKTAMATDIHFGGKGNSKKFNADIVDFFEWFIEEAKNRGCETCIILGDWHDSRSSINVLTLNYSLTALKMLNDAFDNTYIITGNHDLFYREKRDVHSLIVGEHLTNITVLDEPREIGNVSFVPWLVEEEWKSCVKSKAKYLMGHLELPGFKMNAMIDCPDHGGVNGKHFKNQDYVFTGHFHKRQYKDNIHYIGNPFGHNYGDAGDFERGACFLEWDGKPEYVNYERGPRYYNLMLSELLDDVDSIATDNAYIKVTDDMDIGYEDTLALREKFADLNVREFTLTPKKTEYDHEYDPSEKFETVDGLVVNELTKIESDNFNNNTLIKMYDEL